MKPEIPKLAAGIAGCMRTSLAAVQRFIVECEALSRDAVIRNRAVNREVSNHGSL